MSDSTASGLPAAGRISRQPLEAIVRTLCVERRNAVISVQTAGGSAQIEIENGDVTRSRYKDAEGDEALVRILSLTSGTFEIDLRSSSQPGDPAQARLSRLIVEALKRRAQIEALTAALGGSEEQLRVDMAQLGRQLDQVPDEVNPILRLCDSELSLEQVLNSSPFDEVITLRVLERLAALRVVLRSNEAGLEVDASSAPPMEWDALAPHAAGQVPSVSKETSDRIEAFISTPPTPLAEGTAASAEVPAAERPATAEETPAQEDSAVAEERQAPAVDDVPAREAREQVSASWRAHLEGEGGPPPTISLWRDGNDPEPSIARWTDQPRPPFSPEDAVTNGEGWRGGSIAEALGGETPPPDLADQDLPDWLDAQEASFFGQAAGQPLPHEVTTAPPPRDIFPLALGLAFVLMLLVGAGILVWNLVGARFSNPPVELAKIEEPPGTEPGPPPRPHILTPEDEAKVQTPFEAAADVARGAHAEESTTVLGVGAPVVKVLRDVEDLQVSPGVAVAPLEIVASPQRAATPAPAPAPAPALEPVAASASAPSPSAAHLPTPPADPPMAGEDHVRTPVEPAPVEPAVAPVKPAAAPAESAVAPVDAAEDKGFAQIYAEGVQLLQRERYKQALVKFEQALLQDPGDARVYLSIGQIYFEYGQLDRALSYYRKAEALAPKHPKVHLLMGLALHESGKVDAARAHYETYLHLAPDGTEAPAVRGILKTLAE